MLSTWHNRLLFFGGWSGGVLTQAAHPIWGKGVVGLAFMALFAIAAVILDYREPEHAWWRRGK